MRQGLFIKKIISSIFITVILLYYMVNSAIPKIIFVPFLICSLSITGQSIALLLNKERAAILFHRLFDAGFFLFYFGFLVTAAYLCIRGKNYMMFAFSILFWPVGVWLAKRTLFHGRSEKPEKTKETAESNFELPVVVSVVLTAIPLLAGIVILISGIITGNAELIFMGAFFMLLASVFVLTALKYKGYFDRAKVDIIRIYGGAVTAAVSTGFILLKYGETHSLEKMADELGLWLIIPILMIVTGVFEVIKCLINKES